MGMYDMKKYCNPETEKREWVAAPDDSCAAPMRTDDEHLAPFLWHFEVMPGSWDCSQEMHEGMFVARYCSPEGMWVAGTEVMFKTKRECYMEKAAKKTSPYCLESETSEWEE